MHLEKKVDNQLDVLQKNTQQLFLFVLRLTLQISKKKFLNEHRLLYIFCKKALHPYAHFCSSTYCILNILWSLFAKLQHSWYIINRYKVQVYYSLFNIMVYINIALKAKKIQWSKYILQLYWCPVYTTMQSSYSSSTLITFAIVDSCI